MILNAERAVNNWKNVKNTEITRLKDQEVFRREFLGNLAHELKTPVFSIQGYILTLLEGGLEDPDVNRNFLERAAKATDRMASILEDLDQITKLEVDELKMEMRSFDLVDLISEIFDSLELKAKEKKIKLKFDKFYAPIYVTADRVKIGQVFTNLIGNSIAYGNESGETSAGLLGLPGISFGMLGKGYGSWLAEGLNFLEFKAITPSAFFVAFFSQSQVCAACCISFNKIKIFNLKSL
jgi:two-component system phosphate regulon sensor histidine kinase PhoR